MILIAPNEFDLILLVDPPVQPFGRTSALITKSFERLADSNIPLKRNFR